MYDLMCFLYKSDDGFNKITEDEIPLEIFPNIDENIFKLVIQQPDKTI